MISGTAILEPLEARAASVRGAHVPLDSVSTVGAITKMVGFLVPGLCISNFALCGTRVDRGLKMLHKWWELGTTCGIGWRSCRRFG